MILTVDIGNTNITLGGFDSDEMRFVSRISTHLVKTEDEISLRLLECLSLHSVSRDEIKGVMISSVVPPLNAGMRGAVRFVFGVEPLFVGPGMKSGIGIRCDTPSSVGSDLIAAAVAAHYIYSGPCLIIDIGTATKMTVVDQNGAFVGTSIIPGVLMGLEALSEKTAQLPKISLEKPGAVIAKNTVDCMRSGVLYGNASLIDGMIDRIQEEFGGELKVYATGGLASFVIPFCKRRPFVDENLVLKGLNILYQKNAPDFSAK